MNSAAITAERPIVDDLDTSFADTIGMQDFEVDTVNEYEPSPEAHPLKTDTEETLDDKIARILDSTDPTSGYRRHNPKGKAMQRHGCHYRLRKDSGTGARKRQVKAENARRNSRAMNSNAAKRKLTRLTEYSGNPRVIAKLKMLGNLLVD